MPRKIVYWGATVLVAIEALFGAFTYLTTAAVLRRRCWCSAATLWTGVTLPLKGRVLFQPSYMWEQ